MPRGIAVGWRWLAIVSPEAAVARLTVRQVVNKTNNVSFVTDYFDDMDSARTRLRSDTTP